MTAEAERPASEGSAAAANAALLGTVVVLNRDLMFGSRIRTALRSLGYAARVVGDTKTFVRAVRTAEPAAALGVIDMNTAVDWKPIRDLMDDPATTTPLLAFGPHVDVEGRRAAKAAGVTRIVSNGDFHRDTVGLLRRYARDAAPDA